MYAGLADYSAESVATFASCEIFTVYSAEFRRIVHFFVFVCTDHRKRFFLRSVVLLLKVLT